MLTGSSQVPDSNGVHAGAMSEKNDPTPAESSESAEPVEPAPVRRTVRDRLAGTGDRVYGARALLAATLAALIVGGLGGAAVHAAVDDGHDHGRFSRDGIRGGWGGETGDRFGGGERPGPPRDFQRAPGVPGQLPPTTVPTPEESTPTPSESSES